VSTARGCSFTGTSRTAPHSAHSYLPL
jgi:hypothetical protein